MPENMDKNHDEELQTGQLDQVAGGRTPVKAPLMKQEVSEIGDADMDGVSGGADTGSSSDSLLPLGWRKPETGKEHTASEL